MRPRVDVRVSWQLRRSSVVPVTKNLAFDHLAAVKIRVLAVKVFDQVKFPERLRDRFCIEVPDFSRHSMVAECHGWVCAQIKKPTADGGRLNLGGRAWPTATAALLSLQRTVNEN